MQSTLNDWLQQAARFVYGGREASTNQDEQKQQHQQQETNQRKRTQDELLTPPTVNYLCSLPFPLLSLVLSFLPMSSLLSMCSLSVAVSRLSSHPSTDHLWKRLVFDPNGCDKTEQQTWRDYVLTCIERGSLHRSSREDQQVVYQVTSRGGRMYWGLSKTPSYWYKEESAASVFGNLLGLRHVCWLQVDATVDVPAPTTTNETFRYRFYWRVALQKNCTLQSPVFSVRPHPDTSHLCTSVTTTVTDRELRALASDSSKGSPVPGCEAGYQPQHRPWPQTAGRWQMKDVFVGEVTVRGGQQHLSVSSPSVLFSVTIHKMGDNEYWKQGIALDAILVERCA